MISETKLDEWMQDYNDGYEKAYKCIPDLIAEVRALRKVAEAAQADAHHVSVMPWCKDAHPYITWCGVQNHLWVEWIHGTHEQLHDALKAWRGGSDE